MLKKAAALFLVCASIALWVSCGTTSSSYLYAAIPGSNEIVVYREDPNSGILTQLVASPVTAGSAVHAIVIHPSKKFLFAVNAGDLPTGDISLFNIAATGDLTEVTPRTPAGTSPTLLAMDAAGSFLYVGNTGSFNISVFAINSTSGALTPVSGSPFPIGMSPINLTLAPSGNFLYVTGAGSGVGAPGLIQAFAVSQGMLTTVPNSPFFTGTSPFGLAIDSTGKYLYTANFGNNSISEFTIQSDGSLQEFANSPIGETYSSPVALFIDKSNKYLYVANEGSANLGAYSIGGDGSLTLLTTSPFATGTQPSFITSDGPGKHLFVGNQTTPVIQSFSLDPTTGTLTSVFSYTVPGTPTSIAVTP